MRAWILAFAAWATAISLGVQATAQGTGTEVSAELEVRGIYDDNAALSGDPESLFVLAVSPAVDVSAPLRFFDVLASYRLTYFNYTTEDVVTRAPDFAHDAKLRAALTMWEGVDVIVADSLQSVGLTYGLPHDSPENLVLQNTATGRLGVRFDIAQATYLGVGYDADRVDYLDDSNLPPYLMHGPELYVGRELTRDVALEAGYAFRLQDFDNEGDAPGASKHGDYSSQNGRLTVRYQGSRWNAVRFSAGYQYLTPSESTLDPFGAFQANLGVELNPSPLIGFTLGGGTNFTTDLDGTPAQRTEGRLVTSLDPIEPLNVQLEIAYGQLSFVPENADGEDRRYTRGEVRVDWTFVEYVRARAGYMHHVSDIPGAPDVDVNRFFIAVVGQYQ